MVSELELARTRFDLCLKKITIKNKTKIEIWHYAAQGCKWNLCVANKKRGYIKSKHAQENNSISLSNKFKGFYLVEKSHFILFKDVYKKVDSQMICLSRSTGQEPYAYQMEWTWSIMTTNCTNFTVDSLAKLGHTLSFN